MDDGRQSGPVHWFLPEGTQDLLGERGSLFLVFVEEDVLEGDLQVAKEVSDHLPDALEVVVDEEDGHVAGGSVLSESLRGLWWFH